MIKMAKPIYIVKKPTAPNVPSRVEMRNGQPTFIPGSGARAGTVIFDPNVPESIREQVRATETQQAVAAGKPTLPPPSVPVGAPAAPGRILAPVKPTLFPGAPLYLPPRKISAKESRVQQKNEEPFVPPSKLTYGWIEPYTERPRYLPKGYETREEAMLFEARKEREGTVVAALLGVGEKIEKETTRVGLAPKPITRIAGTIAGAGASAAVGVGIGVTGVALHPIKTAKEIGFQVTHPFTAMEMLGQSLQERPAMTIGAMYGGGKAIETGFKLQPLRVRKVTIPSEIVGEEKTAWVGISAEKFGRAQPLLGISKEGLVAGTPKVTYLKTGGYLPKTATDTMVFLKNIERTIPETQKGIAPLAVDIMRSTEKTSSAFIAKEFIRETRTLSKGGISEAIASTKGAKGEIYGSFSQRPQMPPRLQRVPGDIDIYLKTSAEKAETFTTSLVGKLAKKGEIVRVSPTSPTLIEAKVGGKWVHAVDIHAEGIPQPYDSTVAGETAFGLQMLQKRIKIEGVKATRLSEEGIRKGASAFALREGELRPELHRTKDIGDFFRIQETLAESKRFGKEEVLGKIGELKEYYPGTAIEKETKIDFELTPSKDIPSSLRRPGVPGPSIIKPSPSPKPSPKPSPSPFKPSLSPYGPSVSPKPSPYKYLIRPSPSPKPSPRPSPSLFKPSISPHIPSPYKPSPSPPPSIKPSPPPPPPPPSYKPSTYKYKTYKVKEIRLVKEIAQPKKYKPTARAALLGITRPRKQIRMKGLTGLEERPMVRRGRHKGRLPKWF
jgi:hypothetical protein